MASVLPERASFEPRNQPLVVSVCAACFNVCVNILTHRDGVAWCSFFLTSCDSHNKQIHRNTKQNSGAKVWGISSKHASSADAMHLPGAAGTFVLAQKSRHQTRTSHGPDQSEGKLPGHAALSFGSASQIQDSKRAAEKRSVAPCGVHDALAWSLSDPAPSSATTYLGSNHRLRRMIQEGMMGRRPLKIGVIGDSRGREK